MFGLSPPLPSPALFRRSEQWVIPASGLTLISYIVAAALPRFTGMQSPFGGFLPVLIFWLVAMTAVGSLIVIGKLIAALRAPAPLASLHAPFSRWLAYGAGLLLASLNLTAFGFIKPQLGHLVAFSADPLLAALDHVLFFGADGWQRLTWMHHPGMPQVYHQAWFGWVFLVFFLTLCRPPSEERNALLIAYFALWSVFGPLVHLMVPAAGPVFWHELGLGDRFNALPMAGQTIKAKQYLWVGYVSKTYNAAGGISAMPSLHLATMGWTVLALRNSRLLWPSIAITLYMLTASVAIGWHYLTDGIVGMAGAVLCYAAVSALYSRGAGFIRMPAREVAG